MHALIVLGGDRPDAALMRECIAQADFSIAADSGLCAFDACDLVPDLLLGDMDSVPPDVLARYEGRTAQERLCAIKDDTDGVHALDVAASRGAHRVTLLGALGGRLDHALANVMLLVRAHRLGMHARIVAPDVIITRVNAHGILRGARGNTASLLPLGQADGVTLTGFFYPLTDHTLRSDYPLGVSNVVISDEAHIHVREGDLILFHHAQDAVYRDA